MSIAASEKTVVGGFVIHGNSEATLAGCLEGLIGVCDHVVAIDSQSTDASTAMVCARGVESISTPWRGYGAARATAVRALLARGVNYLFYLDSDERLDPGAVAVLRRWKESRPNRPAYLLPRHNWARAANGRDYIYKTDWRARLVRSDAASWVDEMIVHEALPRLEHERLAASIEHQFALDPSWRFAKDRRYALLWAVQHAETNKALKPPAVDRLAHFIVDAVFNGAMFRGGLSGLRLAWKVSKYSEQKYRCLAQVRRGEFSELVELFRARQYATLFKEVRVLVGN